VPEKAAPAAKKALAEIKEAAPTTPAATPTAAPPAGSTAGPGPAPSRPDAGRQGPSTTAQ
jgi:hypothetical protein